MVFHIGKNKGSNLLFFTTYRNGRRFGKDHALVNAVAPTDRIPLGFSISQDNLIAFQVADETVHEDHLPSEARDRAAILTWADENQCKIEFTDFVLEIDPERK